MLGSHFRALGRVTLVIKSGVTVILLLFSVYPILTLAQRLPNIISLRRHDDVLMDKQMNVSPRHHLMSVKHYLWLGQHWANVSLLAGKPPMFCNDIPTKAAQSGGYRWGVPMSPVDFKKC